MQHRESGRDKEKQVGRKNCGGRYKVWRKGVGGARKKKEKKKRKAGVKNGSKNMQISIPPRWSFIAEGDTPEIENKPERESFFFSSSSRAISCLVVKNVRD